MISGLTFTPWFVLKELNKPALEAGRGALLLSFAHLTIGTVYMPKYIPF
jgi:hypothetical protein